MKNTRNTFKSKARHEARCWRAYCERRGLPHIDYKTFYRSMKGTS